MRWLALILFVAVLAVAFVNLGQWQLRRLDQRRAQNAIIVAKEQSPVIDFEQAFAGPVGEDDEWQRVELIGTFDRDHSYVIRYRNNNDQKGYEAVSPLTTSGGQTVLVDRGFVTVEAGEKIPDTVPPPPEGEVSILGRVRASETGPDKATVPVDGQARLINSAKLGADLGRPVVDGFIDVVTMEPADTVEFEVRALPELNDGPHFWYAVQWFMFTGIGVLGVVVFIRGDLRERRERRRATDDNDTEQDRSGSP